MRLGLSRVAVVIFIMWLIVLFKLRLRMASRGRRVIPAFLPEHAVDEVRNTGRGIVALPGHGRAGRGGGCGLGFAGK